MKIFVSNLRFCAVAAYFCKRNSTLRCFASYVIPLRFPFHSKCTFLICYFATSTPTFAALLFLRSQFRVISFSIEIINRAIYEIIEFNCISMQYFITKTLLFLLNVHLFSISLGQHFTSNLFVFKIPQFFYSIVYVSGIRSLSFHCSSQFDAIFTTRTNYHKPHFKILLFLFLISYIFLK